MTSISSVLPVYTPPANPPVAQDITAASVSAPAVNAQPTNANVTAPAVYTALANESAPTIRGTTLNTSA